MFDRDIEDSRVTQIIRTGYPTQQNYPERDDVEVVEISEEEYANIIERRYAERKCT